MKPDRSVSEIMQREFVSLSPGDQLDFAEDIMRLGRVRHMPVLQDDRLVGIVSQRDLLSASLSKVLDFDPKHRRTFLRSVKVDEVMSGKPITASPETSLTVVAQLLIRHKIGCVPVVDADDHPLGLVTEVDLLRAVYEVEESPF